jgi:hypothetical protein
MIVGRRYALRAMVGRAGPGGHLMVATHDFAVAARAANTRRYPSSSRNSVEPEHDERAILDRSMSRMLGPCLSLNVCEGQSLCLHLYRAY